MIILCRIVMVALILGLAGSARAAGPISVSVNGEPLRLDVAPTVAADLIRTARAAGITVLHVMPPLFEPELGAFDESELAKLDYFVAEAAIQGLYVMPAFLHGLAIAQEPTDPYFDPQGIAGLLNRPDLKVAFERRIAALVGRRNTVNGRLYREDPTILAWILVEEPLSAPANYPHGAPVLTARALGAWLDETAVAADILYVGANRGEFGGALYGIHLDTGMVVELDWAVSAGKTVAVSFVSRSGGIETLAAAPTTAVTALAPDLGDPASLLLAQGEWHLSRHHGGLFRLRGETKELLLAGPAVFDLKVGRGGCWAATATAVWEISRDRLSPHAYGDFQAHGGVLLCQLRPGVCVCLTSLNQQAAVCGPTPLVAVEAGVGT